TPQPTATTPTTVTKTPQTTTPAATTPFAPAPGKTTPAQTTPAQTTPTPPKQQPPGAPGVPSIMSKGSGEVVLGWHPAAPNGRPIGAYLVEDGSGRSGPCPASPCPVDGLTNGKDYRFRVQARSYTTGPFSGFSAVVTPDEVPGIVNAPTAVAKDSAVTVTW